MAASISPPDPEVGVTILREGGLLQLMLDRPAARNALTGPMYDALRKALETAETEPDIAVVLLAGAGSSFCAGNDAGGLDLVRSLPMEQRPGYRFMRALARFPKPVVVAVKGHAVGIGATMLPHCDLVYVGVGARFRMPFAQIGLVPEFSSSFLLPRMAGHARAAKWLILGDPFDAHEALTIGLATEVLPDEEVDAHAGKVARLLVALPHETVRLTKKLMRDPVRERTEAILDVEMGLLGERMESEETRQLIAALQARVARDK